jgi:hypothetical protein
MIQRRRSVQEIFSYCKATRQVVTIPAGEALNVTINGSGLGLYTIYWEGRILLAACHDIEEHSALIPEPVDDWVPFPNLGMEYSIQ